VVHQVMSSGCQTINDVGWGFVFLSPVRSLLLPYTLQVDREAREGRLGVLVRNLRTMKVMYWINVSAGSAANLLGLSQRFKEPLNCCCCCYCCILAQNQLACSVSHRIFILQFSTQ